jgi:hypothetical protein
MQSEHFEILIDGTPYMVTATPYRFNDEVRFKVRINDSADYIFAWDSSVRQIVAIGDEGINIPDNVETEIGGRLQAISV